MSHLQPLGYVGLGGIVGLQPPILPDRLRFSSEQGIAARIHSATTPSTIVEINSNTRDTTPGYNHVQPDLVTHNPANSSLGHVEEDHEEDEEDTGLPMRSTTLSQRLLSQFEIPSNTQSSHVPEMKQTLMSMMHHEYFTQENTQTQAWPSSARIGSRDPGIPLAQPSTTIGVRPALSQSVVKTLEQSKSTLRQNARRSVKTTRSGRASKDHLIVCGCSDHDGDGDSVCCIAWFSSRH